MAEARTSFPMLPVAHWWTLRKKFKQSIPGVVTENYLATVLNMTVESARKNVLPFLKPLGIIDDEGRTTERAKLWRDDGHYPEVCKAITAGVYPQELLETVPNPRDNRGAVKRWFANHTGSGDSACGRMAALYRVLIEADPAAQPDGQSTKAKESIAKKKPAKASGKSKGALPVPNAPAPVETSSFTPTGNRGRDEGPEISINLQIHISADASPDQSLGFCCLDGRDSVSAEGIRTEALHSLGSHGRRNGGVATARMEARRCTTRSVSSGSCHPAVEPRPRRGIFDAYHASETGLFRPYCAEAKNP